MTVTLQWKTTLWAYVDQIRSTVYFLRVQKFSNPVQFRCAAEEVGRALMSFKAYARHEYDNLSREKASLETELEVDERKVDSCIEKWMYGTSRRENDERRASATETGREVSGLPANPKTEQQYRESVTALQTMLGALEIDLLKGGDPLGGWEATDHQAFERIIHHIGGQTGTSGLVIQLKRALPHISKDSIEAHLVWHNEHTELTTRKQELVKKYRDLKSAYAAEKSEQREAEKAEMQRIRNEDECRKMTKQREMDQDRQEGIQRKEKQRYGSCCTPYASTTCPSTFRRQQLLQEQHKRKERELLSAKLEVFRKCGHDPYLKMSFRVSCRKSARNTGGLQSQRNSWNALQRETAGETEPRNMFFW
uniref:Uncharacterized protein n=1 Tax=Toxoplasma gondii (strain ATCC 50861 / VEG) TaxID=432359 RepID=A0A0F7V3D2_TOXGV|nr:TPA: hypothetical protein BN1205_017935 [Toxoplasma gondii VEG]